ncbi:MAG: SAM-dependent methyltransferase [Pelagibacteraceae bacterium]|nr:SAM-dependent methyltransferase [Pelagibacteraceae bacterium]
MSSQIEINKNTIQYLDLFGYKNDKNINQLVNETKKLGNVSKMQISAGQGKFIEIIVKMIKPKNCLEIGRFTGLSSMCIARGLPKGGKLYAVDNSREFIDIAEKYWKIDKVKKNIISIIADGKDTMKNFLNKKILFDFIFIDADKNNYLNYYKLSIKLLNKGGVLIFDNMLWGGNVTKNTKDKTAKTIHDLNKFILQDKRIDFSLLPIADGVSIIRKI